MNDIIKLFEKYKINTNVLSKYTSLIENLGTEEYVYYLLKNNIIKLFVFYDNSPNFISIKKDSIIEIFESSEDEINISIADKIENISFSIEDEEDRCKVILKLFELVETNEKISV